MDGRGCAADILQTYPLIISKVYTQTLYYHLMQERTGTFFLGRFMALKGPVGRGQAVNGCGHLERFSKL